MIPVDSSEVFTIAGSYFYYFLTTFSCLNLKKEDIGVRHFAITQQMRIVIPEIIALSKNKACGECSPVNLGELKITIFKMAAVTIILVTNDNDIPEFVSKLLL